MKKTLLEEDIRPGYSDLRVEPQEINATIYEHPEFVDYSEKIHSLFNEWSKEHRPRLMGITSEESPKSLIDDISEDLLSRFAPVELIDKYNVYQQLMAYWTETMQDDVYLILEEGWEGANQLRLLKNKSKEDTDLKIGKLKYKADLIPPDLLAANYFAAEKGKIKDLESELGEVERRKDELEEEHGGEEGLLEEVKSDAGNVTKGAAKTRLKEIRDDPDYSDEIVVLENYLQFTDQESRIKREISDEEAGLNKLIYGEYQKLNADEIKALVVVNKWYKFLSERVQAELDSVTRQLATRIVELAERYEKPMHEIEKAIDYHRSTVKSLLAEIGFETK